MPEGYCYVNSVTLKDDQYYTDGVEKFGEEDGYLSYDEMMDTYNFTVHLGVNFVCGGGLEPTPKCGMCVEVEIYKVIDYPVPSLINLTTTINPQWQYRGGNAYPPIRVEGDCSYNNSWIDNLLLTNLAGGTKYKIVIKFGNLGPAPGHTGCDVKVTKEIVFTTPI